MNPPELQLSPAPEPKPATVKSKPVHISLSPTATKLMGEDSYQQIKLALGFILQVRNSGNKNGRSEFTLKDVCHVVEHLDVLLGNVLTIANRKGKDYLSASLMRDLNRVRRTFKHTIEESEHAAARLTVADAEEWQQVPPGIRYRALDALICRPAFLKTMMLDTAWHTRLEVVHTGGFKSPEEQKYAASILEDFVRVATTRANVPAKEAA